MPEVVHVYLLVMQAICDQFLHLTIYIPILAAPGAQYRHVNCPPEEVSAASAH